MILHDGLYLVKAKLDGLEDTEDALLDGQEVYRDCLPFSDRSAARRTLNVERPVGACIERSH